MAKRKKLPPHMGVTEDFRTYIKIPELIESRQFRKAIEYVDRLWKEQEAKAEKFKDQSK